MILSPEGIATLTLLFKFFLGTVITSATLVIFLNIGSNLEDKEKKKKQKEISNALLKNYSINNAMLINRETINRNNYVRPPEKSIFEDIIKETQKQTDTTECNIIKNVIKCYPRNFLEEDSLIESQTTLDEDITPTYSKPKTKTLKK